MDVHPHFKRARVPFSILVIGLCWSNLLSAATIDFFANGFLRGNPGDCDRSFDRLTTGDNYLHLDNHIDCHVGTPNNKFIGVVRSSITAYKLPPNDNPQIHAVGSLSTQMGHSRSGDSSSLNWAQAHIEDEFSVSACSLTAFLYLGSNGGGTTTNYSLSPSADISLNVGNVSVQAQYVGDGWDVWQPGNSNPTFTPGLKLNQLITQEIPFTCGSGATHIIDISAEIESLHYVNRVPVAEDANMQYSHDLLASAWVVEGTWMPGDLTGDGMVNAADIDGLASNKGALYSANTEEAANPRFDLNVDGVVDFGQGQNDSDLLIRNLLGTEYGDADLDGKVGGSDFTILSLNFGKLGGWAQGDFTGDGRVNSADYTILAGNFGFDNSTVPEPAQDILCLAILVSVYARLRPGV